MSTFLNHLPSARLLLLSALALVLGGCGGGSPTEEEEIVGPVYPPMLGPNFVNGREVWIQYCKLCHEDGGEDDAPLLGDKADWAARSEKGIDELYQNALNGVGDMPARAGRKELDEESLRKAVEYMVEASR